LPTAERYRCVDESLPTDSSPEALPLRRSAGTPGSGRRGWDPASGR
jgi:hypothetical protein